jgi:Arc/MetJ-type ribon-helix-helix transcriptional regulator
MPRERLQVRLPDDMADRIKEFREERGLNESEAGRRLLLRGLDAVDEIETADTPAEVDDATPDDAETTSFRQDSSRAERWLGSAVRRRSPRLCCRMWRFSAAWRQ